MKKLILQNVGLVLEGGGMRGAYTAGVLDAFMDEKIKTSYIIGVSAGANNGADFMSDQRDRNKKVFVDIVKDPRHSGLLNLCREGSYFGMNFIFNTVANELIPFDYDTFYNSPVTFKVCTTDCKTGEAVYFSHKDFEPKYFAQKILRASCSLPIISSAVEIKGRKYLDGGMVDPIPIQKSIEDGNKYNIVILTRNKGYQKKPSRFHFIMKAFLHKYPEVGKALKNRYKKYNDCIDEINRLEEAGKVYVFRPQKELFVNRLEKDIEKLNDLYEQGYYEAMEQMDSFKNWITNIKKYNSLSL
ncbi:patatin-like phospholipase family protein [Inediibacterium massiliense]|uniref:patatin-like phospholipase family protein n=1 Tax=Inediibacterium massiliense TaxID=1658111 RepID=UPI001FA792DB|nr:patatin family protein [Inediibacterium massiliense]